VLKPDMTLNLDALCAWLERQGVAKLKWPERLVPIAEMPMTPTRKVIKGALARLLPE
jgi:non-ribosomal peptide synthetase component E (peptide arylation enzyme)